jgi:inner membrane protein
MQSSSRSRPFKSGLIGASPITDAIFIEKLRNNSHHGQVSPITHFLIGWSVANITPALERRDRAMITWASVVPDVDGLGIVPELLTRHSSHPLNWWSDYHHVLGHNLTFAFVTTAVAALFAKNRRITAVLVFFSFHLHLLGDLVGARGPEGEQWPIPYLVPISNVLNLTWSGQWALNAWQNMVITALLIALSFVLAWKRGFSPLELFSKRADTVFIETIRNRVER